MTYEYSIADTPGGATVAQCGPMHLVIQAWRSGRPLRDLAHQAASQSFRFLESVARMRATLSRPHPQISAPPADVLAGRMVRSVKAVGDPDLTPMAAVAGTIADAVADWIFQHEATKVIVDNGGDIAIRLAAGETASVGIRPRLDSPRISHVLALDAVAPAWGVTTSGLGGRSFTRGIASAVTVLARTASAADAASTAIANACCVKDRRIIQMPADQLDPDSDLADMPVTVNFSPLSSRKLATALESARSKAVELARRGLIVGCLIFLQGKVALAGRMQPYLQALNRVPDRPGGRLSAGGY